MKKECKKCGNPLSGKQLSYCSVRCSRRHLKLLWQIRKGYQINERRRKWRRGIEAGVIYDKTIPKRIKENARKRIAFAIKEGKISKLPCRDCGISIKVQAHHPNYSRPLEVVWLCPQHHIQEHRKVI